MREQNTCCLPCLVWRKKCLKEVENCKWEKYAQKKPLKFENNSFGFTKTA